MTTRETTRTLIDTADSLNTIVVRYPQTLPVLQRFGLDTCCGGALPLHTAAERHNLNLGELIAALRAAAEQGRR